MAAVSVNLGLDALIGVDEFLNRSKFICVRQRSIKVLFRGIWKAIQVGALVKMNGATAMAAVEDFNVALNRMPPLWREMMAYDRDRKMACHMAITQNASVSIYFCDLNSPWQRCVNETINGLIRQYLPKRRGQTCWVYRQAVIGEISLQFKMCARKRFEFKKIN